MEIINHKKYSDLHDASLLNDKCIFKSDTCHSFRTFDDKGNTLEFHTYPVKPFDKLLTSEQQRWIDLFNSEDKF